MRVVATISLLLAMFAASTALAEEFSPAEEDRIKALALEALLERPEILREAIAILRQREEAEKRANAGAVLSERRDELERDPNAPVLGNPDGDVTVVEFFDYNCPYCKRAAEAVKALLGTDGGVRLVYREWPILGEDSMFAARAALAAREQGKYEEMHWALMALPRATEASVRRAAEELGLDMAKLDAAMDAPEVVQHIALSMDLARNLGFTGTPSFVIGDALVPGLAPLERMPELVAGARTAE